MKRPELQWKLDPVAIAALVLSLIAATGQLVAFARGSSVRLIPPDRVALYSDVAPDGSIFVRVAAHISYANVAQAPYGDLVLKERAEVSIGALTSRQQWNAFGTIKRDGIQMLELSAPVALPGQSAASHFTLFMPVANRCPQGLSGCNPKREFFDAKALALQLKNADLLNFRFEIELIDGHRVRTTCHVPLSPTSRRQLSNVQSAYAYLLCYPDRST